MTYTKMTDEMMVAAQKKEDEFKVACYDPMREFSQKIEDEAAAGYWKMFWKMLFIQLVLGMGVVLGCSFAMMNWIVGWRQIEFTLSDVYQLLKLMYLVQITASLAILGLTQAESCEFVSWQLRAGGSNVIGTMLKILDKLHYCELRLQDMQAFWHDTDRMLDNMTSEGLERGDSLQQIQVHWCVQMRKIYEKKGCGTEVRQKFKESFERIKVWLRDEYVPAWESDIKLDKIDNPATSLLGLQNAKSFLVEMDDWIAVVEFMGMAEIEAMIQGR
jgi:hypothetical protein